MEDNRELNDKQLQLIEVAEHLFSVRGFDGTSVRDIAEEAGINTAMISYYFGSKEKLMEAIFELRSANIRMKVENLLKDDSITPLDKMFSLVDNYIDKILQSQQFHKIMICEQVINKNPVIVELVNNLKKKNLTIVGELIKDGQKKGAFKKNIDVAMLLNTMTGTAMQMLISQQLYKEFNNLDKTDEAEFKKLFKNRLSTHLKTLFNAILT
ncbi:MAG TPA: TetR family transcriptional regulator [Puia sp.]|nr:TetR family transcriptional regulator [Puia sp.]